MKPSIDKNILRNSFTVIQFSCLPLTKIGARNRERTGHLLVPAHVMQKGLTELVPSPVLILAYKILK